MNFQVADTCYSTALQAAQAKASTVGGTLSSAGSNQYVVSVGSVTATSITYNFKLVGGTGATTTTVAPYSAQPCNMLSMADGVQIGWMIAAVWIGVYAVLFLARAFSNKHKDDDYGNA